jgi:hypothetical protein
MRRGKGRGRRRGKGNRDKERTKRKGESTIEGKKIHVGIHKPFPKIL